MKQSLVLAFISLVFLNMGIDNAPVWNGDPKYPVFAYERTNAKGSQATLQMGMYPEIDYFLDWGKGFKSLHMKDGYEMMCYSFMAFQGEKYHLSGSSMDIESDAGFLPMSVKIIKTKEPDPCSNYIRFEIPGVKNLNKVVRTKAEEKYWYEASSFCASCGEQIGVDYSRSGLKVKLVKGNILQTSGMVTCLSYPTDTFFESQADKE